MKTNLTDTKEKLMPLLEEINRLLDKRGEKKLARLRIIKESDLAEIIKSLNSYRSDSDETAEASKLLRLCKEAEGLIINALSTMPHPALKDKKITLLEEEDGRRD